MGRETGSWLSGPASAGYGGPAQDWRGQRLGLPESGAGSVAPVGRHLLAYLGDVVAANLLVGLVYAAGSRPAAGERGTYVLLAYLLEVGLLVMATGQSVGHRVAGVRVVRLRDGGLPGLMAGLIRTALAGLLIPVLIRDRDDRGLHDKAAGTVAVRVR